MATLAAQQYRHALLERDRRTILTAYPKVVAGGVAGPCGTADGQLDV
jgi:hypothetical protein